MTRGGGAEGEEKEGGEREELNMLAAAPLGA
jgi:hypothetical protein